MSRYFNTYFIFITATQPLIFNNSAGAIKSLVKNNERYYSSLNRVVVEVNIEPISLADFKMLLKNELNNTEKDVMIVLNTIEVSKEVFDFVRKLNLENTNFYYMSTNIIPRERLARIKHITEQTAKRKIIVSTQLVEAGVDLDVDIIYRDFAPLDSINQVAGRCNRNFKHEQGLVKIFVIQNETGRKYSEQIYGSFLISKTKEVLKDLKHVNEADFFKINNDYNEKVLAGMSDSKSDGLIRNIKRLEFEEISNFKLIEDAPYKIDVFIEIDDKAERVWQKYEAIMKKGALNSFKRKEEFLRIKKDFYDYVISVPKFEGAQDGIINYISKQELGLRYDPETGFINRDSNTGSILT